MGDFDIGSLLGGSGLGSLLGGGDGGGAGDLLGGLTGGGGGGGGGGIESLLGGITGGGGGLGGLLGGGMGAFDPLSGIADAAAGVLNKMGVPKEITDAGKIVAGAYCGDPGLIVDGGVGELNDLCQDAKKAQNQPAQTEMPPATTEASSVEGYSKDDDGRPSSDDVQVQVRDGATNVDVDVKDAAWHPSSDPGDGDEGYSMQAMSLDSPDVLNWIPSDPEEAAAWSEIRRQHHVDDDGPDSPLQDAFDGGGKEGYARELRNGLMSDPKLREDFEEHFHCKVSTNLSGGPDEVIVSKRTPEIIEDTPPSDPPQFVPPHLAPPNVYVAPPATPPTHGDGDEGGGNGNVDINGNGNTVVNVNMDDDDDGGDDIGSIMKDPSMSIEDKIQMVIQHCEDNIDKQISDVTDKLDKASQSKTNGQQGNSDVQKLQMQLQNLMQQRQEMFSMASNISKDFHEMGMTAINNMKG